MFLVRWLTPAFSADRRFAHGASALAFARALAARPDVPWVVPCEARHPAAPPLRTVYKGRSAEPPCGRAP